jgi:hypothetical protein
MYEQGLTKGLTKTIKENKKKKIYKKKTSTRKILNCKYNERHFLFFILFLLHGGTNNITNNK